MIKRAAVGLAAIGLLGGVAPEAQAAPVLEGSTVTTTGIRYGCEGAYCRSFRIAGCPEAMATPEGVTTSIVDVSDLGGETLTFSWSDASMQVYDALDQGVPVTVLQFYTVSSCAAHVPSELLEHMPVAFALDTTASGRSDSYTIPLGTKWLIAEPWGHATAVTWSAS